MGSIKHAIGKRIAALRKKHHMTQEELAEALDISIKHCSCVERGRSALSLEKLVDASKLFDTTLDFLITGEQTQVNDIIPHSFQEYIRNADTNERNVVNEYLDLFLKLRNKA